MVVGENGLGAAILYDENGSLKNQITDGYFVTGNIERIDTLTGSYILRVSRSEEKGIPPLLFDDIQNIP
ncbi:MAG: hypothetical protein R2744_08210 [Bacteroidales bacterium]